MNNLVCKCFYFLGLTLIPILSSAQNKDSNTTVKDSISDNLIIINDSLANEASTAVPINQIGNLANTKKEKLVLFKPTESSSYILEDNELAAKFDSLWMKELVNAAPLLMKCIKK